MRAKFGMRARRTAFPFWSGLSPKPSRMASTTRLGLLMPANLASVELRAKSRRLARLGLRDDDVVERGLHAGRAEGGVTAGERGGHKRPDQGSPEGGADDARPVDADLEIVPGGDGDGGRPDRACRRGSAGDRLNL